MRFKGQLLLPDEPGPGLRVDLDVAEHHLAVESDGGGLGAWPLEVVDVERKGDVFSLTVAGEPLRFVADDTIAFAYSGVPTIERVVSRRPRSRSTLRSMFERIWTGPGETESTTVLEPTADEAPASDESPDRQDEPVEAPSPEATTGPTVEVVEIPTMPLIDDTDLVEDRDDIVTSPRTEAPTSPPGEDLAGDPGCPAIRSDGRRCESPILTSSGYCYPHDPRRAFEDRYQAAQEARARLRRDATARLNRVYSRLDKAMRQVEQGDLDPETAMAMAQLARTMCAILDMDESAADDSR